VNIFAKGGKWNKKVPYPILDPEDGSRMFL
jgi:hypothetical protein